MIGLSIDNTAEIHSTINVTIAVRDAFINLERLLFENFNDEKGLDSSIDSRFENMSQLINKMIDIKKQISFF